MTIDPELLVAIAGPAARAVRFPQDVRNEIESAAVQAQRDEGIQRGPAERQQVQTFIRAIEVYASAFVSLRKGFAVGPRGIEIEFLSAEIARS